METVPIMRPGGRRWWAATPALILVVAALAAGCSSTAATSGRPGRGPGVVAVAAEDTWGSLLRQLGGDRASVTSLIRQPSVDPHSYEPRSSDGVKLATADVVVVNGVGYDAWASKLVAANPAPRRVVVDVGKVVGAKEGDNPHRWYSPPDVAAAVDAMTSALQRADPADAGYFDKQRRQLTSVGLEAYDDLRAQIRTAYSGTPIGISESIVTPLAADLGLVVATPERFADAIAEGNEPTAADTQAVGRQLATRAVRVFVVNSQNATPDVQSLVDAAHRAGIPAVTVTETPTPAGATFQEWQTRQLAALASALAGATGR
ncbi:MAG: metal ABC transporter solute-binding protein, Zn/Mn family [Acidimicrobiales bacterium]